MKKQIVMLLVSAALVLPMIGSAQGVTTKYKSGHLDLTGVVAYNFCNGSYVTMTSGWFQFDYSYTVNGGQVRGNSLYSANGKGQGPSYGYYGSDKYSFKANDHSNFSFSLSSLAQQSKGSGHMLLDQKGPHGTNMFFTYDYLLKISPTGEIDQSVYNYRITCQ